nr:hypothetical protein [Rhodococcus sp. (in: high G+C Gram-positive bacteria)]
MGAEFYQREGEVVQEISFIPKRKPQHLPPDPVDPVVEKPEREAFYHNLKRLRAPAFGNMPAVSVEITGGWQRIADTLWDLGYRLDESVATKRWVATPGMGENSSGDGGKFYERNEDGTWPAEAVAAELDLADIKTHPLADGTFAAIHEPTSISMAGKTKLEAHRLVIAELEKLTAPAEEPDGTA